MARCPLTLSESDQAIVSAERDAHPDPIVRRKMLVLWSTHGGVTRVQTAAVAGLDEPPSSAIWSPIALAVSMGCDTGESADP